MQEKNTFHVNIFMDNELSSLKAGWASLTLEDLARVRKAMKEYRTQNPVCEITGSDKDCQVHHIIPVWQAPQLADKQDNFITLSTSANIHHIFGHDKNFRLKYVRNVKEISKKVLELRNSFDTVTRDETKALYIQQNWFQRIKQKFFEFIIDNWF
jgi:hypothetical protein